MLRLLAVLVMLLATAQPVAAQTETQLPFASVRCLPESWGGSGKGFLTLDNARGTCHGWWCLKPDGTWGLWKHCRIPGYGWNALAAATTALASKPPSLDSFNAFVTQNQVAPTSAGIPFYNALHREMEQALQATKPGTAPTTTLWKTPASGTMTLYSVTATGGRGPAIFGRTAPVNTECGCSRLNIKIAVAGVTANYCPLISNTLNNEVTLCRQVAQ